VAIIMVTFPHLKNQPPEATIAPFISDYVTAGAIMFCGNLAVTQAEFNDYPVMSTQHTTGKPITYWATHRSYHTSKYLKSTKITFPDSVAVGINSIPNWS